MASLSGSSSSSAKPALQLVDIFYGAPAVEGIPALEGDIQASNFRTWWRHCSERMESFGLLEHVTRPRRQRQAEGESQEEFNRRRRLYWEENGLACQFILHTCHPDINFECGWVRPASELWTRLREYYAGLEEPDHVFEVWTNFTRFKYEGKARDAIEEFIDKYRDALQLCKEADLVIDPKVQSIQFLAKLEEHFPEWYREKEHLIHKFSRTNISDESQIPELEDLIRVVVTLVSDSIFALTRKPTDKYIPDNAPRHLPWPDDDESD